MSRSVLAVICLTSVAACFNPDDPAAQTDGGMTEGSSGDPTGGSLTPTMSGGSTADTSSSDATTLDPTTQETGSGDSSSGGPEVPQWGEGDPPDFGDLGDEGEGSVLVVHTLDTEDALDVWLVGETEPVVTGLEPRDAVRLEGVPREARRVVLARTGTLDAVACSEWFPLRADEQWASVATLGDHDCTGGADGATPTFQQAQALTGNTVRYVHGAVGDPLSIDLNTVAEPGPLDPGQTASGTDLPDCESSGCSADLGIFSPGIGRLRHVTFATETVADVPPPGEMLFVILGDVRQDWPREADSISILAVTLEGGARVLRRDPEVAFAAPETNGDVSFTVPAPPAVVEVGSAEPCFSGEACPLNVQRFRSGPQSFGAMGPTGQANDTFDLEAGERYVLLYVPSGGFMMVRDEFSRADQAASVGRVVNWSDDLLTIGRTFNGMAQAFDNFVDVPAGAVSEENQVPDGGWDLLSSSGGAALQTDCFSFGSTPVPWRGLLWGQGQVGLDAWPPSILSLGLICS
ncbi:MAG: hypothetical protein KUG77_22365 [Nannocystaceae bacterium]|nr:hypothetical protein [Nannocystaceae bacterium]